MKLTLEQATLRSVEAYDSGSLAEAEKICRAIMSVQPDNPGANFLLGRIALDVKTPTEALGFFREVLKSNTSDRVFGLSYVATLVLSKTIGMIEKELEEPAKLGFDESDIKKLKAFAKNQDVSPARLSRLLKEMQLSSVNIYSRQRAQAIQKKKPGKPPSKQLIIELQTAFHAREYAGAYRLAFEIVKKHPDFQFAWKILGVVLAQLGNPAAAEEPMRKSILLDPKDAQAHTNLSNVLSELGRLHEAEACCRTAIRLNPKLALAHNNLGNVLSALDRFPEAESCFRAAIQIDRKFAEAHCNLGNALIKQGRLDEAESCCREAIRLNPHLAQAFNNFGNIFHNREQWSKAIESYSIATQLMPHFIDAHNNLGNTFLSMNLLNNAEESYKKVLALNHNDATANSGIGEVYRQTGRLAEAEIHCRKAIDHQKKFPEGYINLGNTFFQAKRLDEAEQSYRKAIHLEPRHAVGHFNLGNVLKLKGDLEAAEAAYQNAVTLNPNLLAAHANLGNLLRENRRFLEAEVCYRKVVSLKPDLPEGHNNLGNVLFQLGRSEEAIKSYIEALRLNSDYAEAMSNLGNVLKDLNRLDEAEAMCRNAIRIKPRFAEAFCNLGVILKERGQLNDAEAMYRKALSINPQYAMACNNLGSVLKHLGRLHEAEEIQKKAIQLAPSTPEYHSNYLLLILYMNKSQEEIWLAQKNFGIQFERDFKNKQKKYVDIKETNRRLKIGYVSGDLRNHAVAFFIKPILEHHNKSLFETFVYSNNPKKDSITFDLERSIDNWRPCFHLNDSQLYELIQNDGIDILIDLSGHTAYNRLLTFARKPAPIQVSWIGYPGSTGLSAIDYRLTYDALDPIGTSEQYHSEKLYRLPNLALPFEMIHGAPDVCGLPALQSGIFTLGCLNGLQKINAEVISLWVEILKEIPNSRFILGNASDNQITRFFREESAARGIDENRLVFVKRMPFDQYINLYQSIDLCVDPFPYNGGTTSLQSIWMGVPVLTLAGRSTQSRVGAAVLERAGLSQFIAQSVEEYKKKAVNWSMNLSDLNSIRLSIRPRLKSSKIESKAITNLVEDAYLKMWAIYCGKDTDAPTL